jgi:hypothetical protein
MVPEAIINATNDAIDNINRYLRGEKVRGIFRKDEYI